MFNKTKEMKRLEAKLDVLVEEVMELRDIVDSTIIIDDPPAFLEEDIESFSMSQEIYDEISKYCDSENLIFMGIA